jgi:hypothetical protein
MNRASEDLIKRVTQVATDLKTAHGQFDEIVFGEKIFDLFLSTPFAKRAALKDPHFLGAKVRVSPYLPGNRFTLMFHGDIVGGGAL